MAWRHFPSLCGAIVWCIGVAVVLPNPFDALWAKALLLFAPLVLVPLVLSLLAVEDALWNIARFTQLPAALLLGGSFVLPQGTVAAVFSGAWLLFAALLALIGLRHLWQTRTPPFAEKLPTWCIAVAMIYLAIGSFWALLDRAAIRPLGFEPIIVLLTAIHFHYAGFMLPILTGLASKQLPGRVAQTISLGVIVAVPFVAIGITASQLKVTPVLETCAAWLMAGAGLGVAWMYLRLASRPEVGGWSRTLWRVAGVSLLFGMVLAALYGARFFLSLEWLSIPWMRALHGSVNVFGFSLAGILGWLLGRTALPVGPTHPRSPL